MSTTTPKPERDFDVRYWWIFPYRWNWKFAFKDLWNPEEPRIFPPKQFGVGWGLNLYALKRKARELGKRGNE